MYSWTLIMILGGVEVILPGFASDDRCMAAMERFIETDKELRTVKSSSTEYAGSCQEAPLQATELT